MKYASLIIAGGLVLLAYVLWRKSQQLTPQPVAVDMQAPDATLSNQVVEDVSPGTQINLPVPQKLVPLQQVPQHLADADIKQKEGWVTVGGIAGQPIEVPAREAGHVFF